MTMATARNILTRLENDASPAEKRIAHGKDPVQFSDLRFPNARDLEDRSRSDDAHRESDRRFHAFWENSPSPIFIKDTQGRYQYVNSEFERALGVRREQIMGRTDRDFFPAAQAAAFWANDEEVLRSRAAKEFEETSEQSDGLHTSIVHKFPLFDQSGNVCAVGGIATDITERKRVEKELALRINVLQNMPAVAWTVTPDGRLDFVNSFFLETTGRSLEECISPPDVWNRSGNELPPFLGGLHPDHKERAAEIFWEGIRSGQGWAFEAPYFHANDQSYHWHFDRAVPLRDADGKIVRFIGSCVDIEELKRAVAKNQTLLEIGNAIVANPSQDTLMRAVSEALHHVVEFDGATLALYVAEKDAFRLFEVDSRLRSEHFRPGLELGRKANSVGWVFEHQKPLVRGNLLEEQEYSNERILAAEGVKSQITVPLIVRRQCIGALALASRTSNLYTQADTDFLREVANQVALAVENMKSYEHISTLKMRLEKENVYLREEISKEHNFSEIVGSSPVLLELLRKVELVAPVDSSVLIWGETGTGKELIARAIHARSLRKDRPLVKLNCGSIPAGLVESELFGHVKGAFTGATANRVGRFELADDGTLFLDEVGELPLDTQVKLLRVLQEQEFEPVGGSRTIRVDVRIVAATNRDLEQAVKAGSFRSDLYYRLNVLPLRVPSLRERRPDIAAIVLFFLDRYCKRSGKKIESVSKETMELLVNYSWPGNIRELQNVIERGVVLCQGSVLTLGPDFLPAQKSEAPAFHAAAASSAVSQSPAGQSTGPASSNVPASVARPPASLEEVESRHILAVLDQTRGLISGPNGAAAILKLNPNTLRSRMKKLGIVHSRHDIS
jgi:formate hydrogenlyase transcriptional activator